MLNLKNLKEVNGYLEGNLDDVDSETAEITLNYKKSSIKNYIPLNYNQIDRLSGRKFYVTRKIDGEFAMLIWDGENSFIINRSGKVRKGLPCVEIAGELFKSKNITEAIIPCEIHVDDKNGRKRVFDVLSTFSKPSKHENLKLAPFDLIKLNGERFESKSYEVIYNKLAEIFSDEKEASTKYIKPVDCKCVSSKNEVKNIFDLWINKEEAEGLVVKSDLPFVFKIKPQYNLDVAVIGFSERISENKNQIRSLLLALIPDDGQYQIIGRVGGGFSEKIRTDLFNKLISTSIESDFIEVDSSHTAFHMVKPEIIIEININDIIFETLSGPIENSILEIKDNVWTRTKSVNGISIVSPIFSRIREDKKPNKEDVRLEQIYEFIHIPKTKQNDVVDELEESKILKRVVYKKETGKKLMVQKFMIWKTNKENQGYPSFVLSHTDFSSGRKEPLKTQIRISNNQEQITELFESFVNKHVKKGWEEL